MAIKTKEELFESLKGIIGDSTEDSALNLLDDFHDTINDMETKAKPNTDWEKRYKENDKMWRDKYKARFFSGKQEDDENLDDDNETPKALTFEALFKED